MNAPKQRSRCPKWMSEMARREFSMHDLEHQPPVFRSALRELRNLDKLIEEYGNVSLRGEDAPQDSAAADQPNGRQS